MNKTQAKKIEVLSKVKLPQDARTLLNKIEKALQGGNSDAKEKANTALDNLFNKVKEVAAKQQSEDKGEKVSPKTVTPKSSDIDEPEQKEEISKVANAVVDPLMEAINNDASLKGFNPKATDVLRDSSRPAMSRGRRVSRKGWKNQYGESAGGRVYYETRENRMDRKAPISKNTKMPWLEHGGHLEGDGFEVVEIMDGNETIILSNQSMNDAKVVAMAKRHMGDNGDYLVRDSMGNIFYSSNPSMFKVGGYMAKGGMTDHNLMIGDTIKQSFGNILVVENDGKTYLVNINTGQRWTDSEWWSLSKGEITKYTKMAKGGVVYTDLKDIPNLMDRVERGYVTYRGLGAFKEGTEITVDGKKYIVTDDDFNSIARDKDGNMRIRFSAPSRKRYEDGGYMAEGGAIENQYEGREPQDIWDSYTKEQKLHFLYDHHEEINEYKRISSEEEKPWFNVSYKSNWANLDEDVKNRFANHVRGGQYAKGGQLSNATYVSNRNIDKVDLTINNSAKTINGKDLVDGLYVKNTALKTPKAKFNAYEVQEELSNMAYDVWDELNIQSGGEIYASKPLQEKLEKAYLKKNIDGRYLKLTQKQRAAVSKALTDENQHSLRNYLALRGYNGDEEYESYKTIFDTSDQKRPYVMNPYIIERKESNFEYGGYMAMGGELTKVDVKLFEKGDKIKISYSSSISRNNEVTLMVKNITLVNKGKSNEKEKITFINLDNPTGVKYYAYISTNSDYVGFAVGDMAISNVKLINKFEDGGSLGDSKYLARMAEEYAEREYEKPVKKGNSTALAGKLPNGKLYYKEITVYFKDGTTHTFMQEDFEEFFDVDDYAKGGKIEVISKDKLGDSTYYFKRFKGAIGSFGWIVDKKYNEGVLFPLDEYSKDFYEHLKLKSGEVLYRYQTDKMMGKFEPLVKINLDKKLVYFVEDSDDEKNPVFNSRGTQLDYVAVVDGYDKQKYAKGGELEKGIRVEMKEHGMSRAKATKTALDHLKENSKYYTKMEEAGLETGGEVEFFDYSNADLDKLPVGLTKYFNKPKGTITIEMSKIVPTRAREKGVKNANKYMLQAYKGEIEKRDPIKVYKQKGKYYVQDGNSTYANAKFSGWKTIYATVVKNPKLVEVSKNRQGNVLSLAKEIRQVGESWQDAIQRAKKMNK
jgi:hypothetical protein